MMQLKEYFAEWDPMGFIKDGAPRDEYDAEAREVTLRFKQDMNPEQMAKMINEVFVEYMEIEPDSFYEDCLQRAPDILEILRSK